MIKLYKVFIGSYGIFLASWLQLFQQHSESLSPSMLKWVLCELLLWCYFSSFFLDHRLLTITMLTLLQSTVLVKKTQIFHRNFLLKTQLSQKVFLQINLPTQAHCCSALSLDTTEKNPGQMVTLWLFFCRTVFPLLNLTKLNLVWLPELDVGAFAVCFVFISTKLRVFSSCFENSLILHLFAAPYELYDKYSVIKPVIFS